MRTIRLLICAGYWGLLTVLLLVPNPAAVVGLRKVPVFPWGDIGIHFTAFTILTLLVHGSRWPRGIGWPFLAVLVAYGITTESLQWFVPSRAVELLDYTENILGVAAGTGIYWLGHRLIRRRAASSS
jgi:VanZ family protein